MEENSESHMETDVSSTTEDVPETQEVTDSEGNVEMVIVVETLSEEDSQSERQQSLDDEDVATASLPTVQESRESPTEPSSNENVLTKGPSVPGSPLRISNKKNMQLNNEVQTSSEIKHSVDVTEAQQTGVADSSVNESPITVTDKQFKSAESSTNGQITVKTPPKTLVNSSNKDLYNTPIKEAPKSPIKELVKTPIKDTAKTPIKQIIITPVNNVLNTPTKELELTPTKELVITSTKELEKSPMQELEKTEKISPKSPPKGPLNSLTMDVQKTPVIETQKTPPIETKKTPLKISLKEQQKTPLKELQKAQPKELIKSAPKNAQKTPIKELQKTAAKELQKNPTKELQESPVKEAQKTPSKEVPKTPSKEVQKTPSKEIQKTPSKEAQKTPSKEVQKSSPKEIQSQDESKVPSKETTLKDVIIVNGKEESNKMTVESKSKNVSAIIPMDVVIEVDASNDSQIDTNSETSNKSISRELKSLINSAKESKIISECTQLTTKTRKSRTALDTSLNHNTSLDAEKIQGRRNSDNSQKSTCSEKSDKAAVKRSMRSQNPEFVSKVKQFLNSVTGKGQQESEDESEVPEEKVHKKKPDSISGSPPKLKRMEVVIGNSGKLRSDPYCWRCHWPVEASNEKQGLGHGPMACTVCPRTFHYKCITSVERSKIDYQKSWVCPDCLIVLLAESSETRSQAMKKISLGMLCELLKHALERMMDLNGVEPFMQPVDRVAFPDYDKYVVHPMDLSLMKNNITEGLYGSTEAFLADAQWIMHNSIIFNTLQSKLTAVARALVRSCRTEMGEIEACAECYSAAHERRPTWFTDVCSTPHILMWAKLKGFPYWPAKAMSINNGMVDVRFFGAHDRAWVPAKDCFLYCEKDPNNFRTKRQDILDSMQEAEQHIRNISRKYGKFVYPPFKTQFDTTKITEQLKIMIPTFVGEVRTSSKKINASPANTKNKSRSNSKSSKGSVNDGESENEEAPTRKMADGAEIAREEVQSSASDKTETSMDVDTAQSTPQTKPKESRKRRRSQLEEAVITIIESSNSTPCEKRRKVEEKVNDKKSETQEAISTEDKEKTQTDKEKTSKETIGKTEKEKQEVNKVKDSEPSSSTEKEKRVTPIRITFVGRGDKRNLRRASITTPNKDNDKPPQRPKSARLEKTPIDKTPKEEKNTRAEKRRNSRNRSLSTPKPFEKKTDKSESASKEKTKDKEANSTSKDKSKELTISKEKNPKTEKSKPVRSVQSPKPKTDSPRVVKDGILFDDDTTLAVIARETSKNVISPVNCGMPTISSVRSLSTVAQNTATTNTRSTTSSRTIEVTVESNSDSCLLIPTSSDNVTNVKDASKLQRLRNDASEPMVGRVGVRAFARMTSPEKTTCTNDDVQVEIKSEPIDLDDADRQMEKLDLMNSFRLRPVNPVTVISSPSSNLREVRINKVVVPAPSGRKVVTKPNEVRPRAKKSFPQPKKPDEGSSGLNSKNSMVYIPIQPAVTGAPVRMTRPSPVTTANTPPVPRPTTTVCTVTTSAVTNPLPNPPVTTPIMTVSTIPIVSTTSTATTSSVPTIGQVPTTVHTVPLMTSVNGQWMFSFQPVMSVGAIDNTGPSPIANGLTDRGPSASLVSLLPPNTTVTATSGNRTQTEGNTPGEPPRLQQRPAVLLMNPLDPNQPVGNVLAPSAAGLLTAKLNANSVKLADYFRSLLEESIEKLDDPSSQVTSLQLQLEQARWKFHQQTEELKHNYELTIAEMRAVFEKDKLRMVSEVRRQTQLELEAAVKIAKSKQWCANCSQEAQFYCCWNTSYCDYGCQRAHWSQHFSVCTQLRADGNGDPPSSPEHRLQPQPDILPQSSSAPALTVGGKLVNSRALNTDQPSGQKTSIIMSMVEDNSGNKTMKCVGTYKSPQQGTPHTPVILNKQIMNNEENANKKMVSSGGYLIVGASNANNTSLVVTPSRRTHTIQQIT